MEIINLKYQVVFFGNYDEVIPSIDNVKYFIENFADKNLIPSQFKKINVSLTENNTKNTESVGLSLTSPDGMWNIRFGSDRVDFFLTNSNHGKVNMPGIEEFLAQVQDILTKINHKFSKTHKRVGLVSQFFFKDIDATQSAHKLNKTIDFFNDKPIIEWLSKITTRHQVQVPDPEIINIISELRWVKANIKILDTPTSLDGLLLNLDINTINENQEYRLKGDKQKNLLEQIVKIHETLKLQNIGVLK